MGEIKQRTVRKTPSTVEAKESASGLSDTNYHFSYEKYNGNIFSIKAAEKSVRDHMEANKKRTHHNFSSVTQRVLQNNVIQVKIVYNRTIKI